MNLTPGRRWGGWCGQEWATCGIPTSEVFIALGKLTKLTHLSIHGQNCEFDLSSLGESLECLQNLTEFSLTCKQSSTFSSVDGCLALAQGVVHLARRSPMQSLKLDFSGTFALAGQSPGGPETVRSIAEAIELMQGRKVVHVCFLNCFQLKSQAQNTFNDGEAFCTAAKF